MKYFLIIGSNWRPARHLRMALLCIQELVPIERQSRIWRTRGEDSSRYLNVGVMVHAEANYDTLHALLRDIEMRAGRLRGHGICSLDVDIVVAVGDSGEVEVFKPFDLSKRYVRKILDELGFEKYWKMV